MRSAKPWLDFLREYFIASHLHNFKDIISDINSDIGNAISEQDFR